VGVLSAAAAITVSVLLALLFSVGIAAGSTSLVCAVRIDTFQGAPRRLPKPLSDHFGSVRCACVLVSPLYYKSGVSKTLAREM